MLISSNISDREGQDLWNPARKALQRTTPRSAPILSAPKCNLYIALPIISKSSKPRGFYNDDLIQNFHQDRLAPLCDQGLISCPIADLSGPQRLGQKHLLCFPSAIIELKHHKVKPSEREKCYCQAANASSSAVAMLRKLSAYSPRTLSLHVIRPVVSFTFIGPDVRVWITYISLRKERDPKKSQKRGRRFWYEYVSEHYLPRCASMALTLGLFADT